MYCYSQEMLSAFYVADTFVGTRNTLANIKDKILKAWSLHSFKREDCAKKIKALVIQLILH